MAIKRDIVFNNRALSSFGFLPLVTSTFVDFPNRQAQEKKIDGSVVGSVINDKGSYGNITREFSFRSVPSKVPYETETEFIKAFIDWSGDHRAQYGKLYDTTRRGYYCNAFIKDISNLTRNFEKCFDVTITFSCQPYWYLEVGQNAITSSGTGTQTITLINPEKYTAYPYIKVKPESSDMQGFSISANNITMTASKTGSYLEFDSEIMNVFRGAEPKNYLISGSRFIRFSPGENTLTFVPIDTTINWDIEVIPRWRCL